MSNTYIELPPTEIAMYHLAKMVALGEQNFYIRSKIKEANEFCKKNNGKEELISKYLEKWYLEMADTFFTYHIICKKFIAIMEEE